MTENIYRTHNCGELRLADAGKKVRLAGWVNSIRRLGGIVFLTLRDHFGITQVLLKIPIGILILKCQLIWGDFTSL